jgi:hypothetical protein
MGDLYDPYNQNRIEYEGENNNRFCTSPIIEEMGTLEPLPFYIPIGKYRSYVILLKGNVLIAIYETQLKGHLGSVGSFSNAAIQKLAGKIQGK